MKYSSLLLLLDFDPFIFQYYYLAHAMEDNKIAFVDLQLSDETKAFIDGPELGGIDPLISSGYRHHVPTMSNLIAAMGVLLLVFHCIS